VLAWWIGTRVALTIVGVVSRALLHRVPNGDFSPWIALDVWGRFDSGWYMSIARDGYSAATSTAPGCAGQANYAFFPLYPMIVRLLAAPFGQAHFAMGLVVSNAALVWAATTLHRIVEGEHDEATANAALAFMFLAPTSFYFSSFLTESLFVALVLAFVEAAMRRRWSATTAVGLAIGFSRPPAVVLALVAAAEASRSPRPSARAFAGVAVTVAALAVGPLAHLAWSHHLTGDWLAFFHVQEAWDRHAGNPFVRLAQGLVTHDKDDRFSAIWATAVALGLAVGARRVRPSWTVFGVASLLLPLSSAIGNMPRLTSTIFAVWIVMPLVLRGPRARVVALVAMAIAQTAFFVLFANGYGVMA
jgi:hypothetical protein